MPLLPLATDGLARTNSRERGCGIDFWSLKTHHGSGKVLIHTAT